MTGKAETEELMNAGIPFAEQQLAEHGEFFPFAFSMDGSGMIQVKTYAAGDEQPDSQSIIDGLLQGFREGAKSGESKAYALFVDVSVQPPGHSSKVDAVQVDLEHVDGFSVTVFFPYIRRAKRVKFGELFASARGSVVFGR